VSRNLDADLRKVDAVVIATPTSTHVDYVMQAGKHVAHLFVEKPLAEDSGECEKIIRFARKNGVRIQVGFIERFNPAIGVLKNVAAHTNHMINVDFSRTSRMSDRITDVDVITDLMVHDIDLALYLNGPAQDVWAYGVMEHGMVAFARGVLRHESGCFSKITASRVTERKTRLIEATSDDMFIECDLLRKEIFIHNQRREPSDAEDTFRITSSKDTVMVPPQEALILEMQEFIRFCRGHDGIPDMHDALNASKIAEHIRTIIEQQECDQPLQATAS
jgi:predicted dehydrogenase